MRHGTLRVSGSRWRHLGNAALALAAVAVIGATSMTPAKADSGGHDWHGHSGVGFGFSIGAPAYGYYPYPAYPAYPAYAYPAYGYPYYDGYYPAYGGPSVNFSFGR